MKRKNNIFRKKNLEKVVDEFAKNYQEKKKNGSKNPIDETVEEIMDVINDNPESVREILKYILNKEEIPNRVFEKTATKISENDEISDEIIVDAVKNSEQNLPSDAINRILREGEVNLPQRLELIKQVENPKFVKEQIINEFKILYKNCKSKTDTEVQDRVQELDKILKNSGLNKEIEALNIKIIAKKMAENYYKMNSTSIYKFSEIMSVEKMLENDLASYVEKEYKKIETEREKKNRFNKFDFRKAILNEIARNIAIRYKTSNAFIIPQSENMKKISSDEAEFFIRKIQVLSDKKLTEIDIRDIESQIRGSNDELQQKENKLFGKIKKISNKKGLYVELLTDIVSDNKKLETLEKLESIGLIEILSNISEENKGDVLESISKVITDRYDKKEEIR